MSGTIPGHDDFVLKEINVSVIVVGMEINPGESIRRSL